MRKKIVFTFIMGSLVSCAVKEGKMSVQMMLSPVDSVSAEPYLFTDQNSTVFLSWVEKRDAVSFLKYARLEGETWSQPVTIDSGSNWFVNWADYPVMAGDGKQFMAHMLQKSDGG